MPGIEFLQLPCEVGLFIPILQLERQVTQVSGGVRAPAQRVRLQICALSHFARGVRIPFARCHL